MSDSPGYELKFEAAKKSELSQFHKSNTVCAVVCVLVLASGIPAFLLQLLFLQLGMDRILHLHGFVASDLYWLAYIISIASMVPVLMLLGSSLLGKRIDEFGSSLLLQPEGIRYNAKDLVSGLMLELLRAPRTTIPWERIKLVALMELGYAVQNRFPDRKVKRDWFMSPGDLCFWGEKKPGGPIEVLCRMRMGTVGTEARRQLLAAIREYAPDVIFADRVLDALVGPVVKERDPKYTEIWLKLLNAERGSRQRESELAAGDLLNEGRFRINRKLATGGQANLFLAGDLESGDQQVVLKEYIVSSATDESIMNGLEEFETESGIMQRIDHPNICKLLDMFVEDSRAYLVLEYAEGESLRRYVEKNGPLSEPQAIDIMKQVCIAVSYLHNQDPAIVHRDISPDNIIINDGKIVLVDFSVANAPSDKIAQVVGKPAYMSVDQFRGFCRKTSDIYSIGATMYYLLVGADPQPVSESHPKSQRNELSEEIDQFVARCTSVSSPIENIDLAVQHLQELQSEISLC